MTITTTVRAGTMTRPGIMMLIMTAHVGTIVMLRDITMAATTSGQAVTTEIEFIAALGEPDRAES